MKHAIAYEDAGHHELSNFALSGALRLQNKLSMDSFMYKQSKSIFKLDHEWNFPSFIKSVKPGALRNYLRLTAIRSLDVEVS